MASTFLYTTMPVATANEQSEVDRLLDKVAGPPTIVGKCPIRIKYADIIAYHPVPYTNGEFNKKATTVYLNGGIILTINYPHIGLDNYFDAQ